MGLSVGEVTARPGESVHGWFGGLRLPTGQLERLPISILQGSDPSGPVLWLTTGLHGDEPTGLHVMHRLLASDLAGRMRGTLVMVLSLNPSGLLARQRHSPYLAADPNRQFPDPLAAAGRPSAAPTAHEVHYDLLLQAIQRTQPAALLDLHNAWIGSIPFVLQDPVFFGGRLRSRAEAARLHAASEKLASTLMLPQVRESTGPDYMAQSLHRSLSAAVLNRLGVPAVTVELGSWNYVEPAAVEAFINGLYSLMRFIGMLEGKSQAVAGPMLAKALHPVIPAAGIVQMLVQPGQWISPGQPVAYLADVFGAPVAGDSLLRSQLEGRVLGWPHGSVRYQGEAAAVMAAKTPVEGLLRVP